MVQDEEMASDSSESDSDAQLGILHFLSFFLIILCNFIFFYFYCFILHNTSISLSCRCSGPFLLFCRLYRRKPSQK